MVEQNARGLIAREDRAIQFIVPHSNNQGFIVGTGDIIFGDATRLQQILNNLISNSGHVRFEVELVPGRMGTMMQFTVEDTGVGIPTAKQETIFEPFRQADGHDSNRSSLGGTGLGLTIAKKLVEKMGGEIVLFSSTEGDNQGTAVRFGIPYTPAEQPPLSGTTANKRTSDRTLPLLVKRKMLCGRVLLVDDNRINLKLTKRIVENLGLICETAENGRIALQKYKEDRLIDVILMDKEMPVLNGLEAVRHIRDEELSSGIKRVPIIALTAAVMSTDRDECLAAGCDDYLSKPVNQNKLAGLLAKYTCASPD